jgi:hypothetical protein
LPEHGVYTVFVGWNFLLLYLATMNQIDWYF